MVLLTVAALVTLAGFLTWGIGILFEYDELVALGGTVIVVVGAMMVYGGLQYQTGEHVVENTTYDGAVFNNTATVYNSTSATKTVQYQYESVSFPQRFSAGGFEMIIGALLIIRPLGERGGIM